MSAKQPSVWFRFDLVKAPTYLGTQLYRWAMHPMADTGSWKEGRVVSWTVVEHALSGFDGDYEIGTASVVLDDKDGAIRSLLGDPATRYFTSREGALEMLSVAGRAAGTAPRMIFRGIVADVQALPGRQASLQFGDCVGTTFTGFDLDATFPKPTLQATEHPNIPAESVGKIYNLVVGDHSDVPIPVVDVGDYQIPGTVPRAPDLTIGIPPNQFTNDLNGLGTLNGYIFNYVTAMVGTAESQIGPLTAGTYSFNRAQRVNWNTVAGATSYRIYFFDSALGQASFNPFVGPGDSTFARYVTHDATTMDGTFGANMSVIITSPTDGTAVSYAPVPSGVTWTRLVVALGAVKSISRVWASDLDPDKPTMVLLDTSLEGTEYLIPTSAGWPYGTPYLELNDLRMSVILYKTDSDRLKAFRDGTVPIGVSACGYEQVGNTTGALIKAAYPAMQLIINEHAIKNHGTGYRGGNWGPLEPYLDGTAKLKSSEFQNCQQVSVGRIGGEGYLTAYVISQPISIREFIRNCMVSYGGFSGATGDGQFMTAVVDESIPATNGRLYRDRIEVKRLVGQQFLNDMVETKPYYSYDVNQMDGTFRTEGVFVEDLQSSQAYLAPRTRATREMVYVRDKATADDVMARYLQLVILAPRLVDIECDLTAFEDDLGARVRLTHYDGVGVSGLGDIKTPMMVMRRKFDATPPETVTLTLLDVSRATTGSLALLQDEGVMTGNLGDETSTLDPPTGAYKLA